MLSRATARELVLQDLDLKEPREAVKIKRNPIRMEGLVDQKLARLQSQKDLALKRGASELQAEELAMEGIQAYDPEAFRANQEAHALNGPIWEGDALDY